MKTTFKGLKVNDLYYDNTCMIKNEYGHYYHTMDLEIAVSELIKIVEKAKKENKKLLLQCYLLLKEEM